ncbi:hypothetical protein PISMIDRAFT_680964 [Pisolithus microcarpus 441]|uniref:Unplaced genomic scaffold scaffold_62, whole genome shotgun sequence n=1 Tax=Pisolithus microcarpus 441 TaxID=765257 RepID=A0A0C9ZQ26_9AGAM|nr:hypothetical protein PISMIDRAFT_680964 [Pisolithus microcarpus 441]
MYLTPRTMHTSRFGAGFPQESLRCFMSRSILLKRRCSLVMDSPTTRAVRPR